MKKLKNVLTILLILVVSFANAQWTSLKKDNNLKKEPVVTILSDSENSTIIDIKLSGFDMNYEIIDGIDYNVLDLFTDSKTNIIGAPSLPIIPSLIAVPDNASVSYEIIETGEVTTYENINILPGRKSWIDGEPETPYNKDVNLYNTNEMFPSKVIKLDKPAIYRDFRIVRLAVSPMQYNPVTKQLKVFSSFKIKLNYIDDGNAINPRTIGKKSITPSFDKLYKSIILNYKSQKGRLDTHLANDLMLCIVPDDLYNDFLPYADWKKRTGIDIRVTKFSDIGANANNPITIKNHITDAYHNWANPPSYVLLVGDDGVFPVKTYNATDGWSFAHENYFVEIDGNDFLPEMLIGRFTNQGNYRMRVMTSKFEKYIRDPYVAETAWYKKGLFSSNSAYQSQVNTIAWTREILLNDAGFTSVDPMMWNGSFDADGNWDGNCNYNVNDVITNLNEGRSVVNYRGEGWITGWNDGCISFHSSDLSSLNPTRKNYFFTNIGCGVAMFDSSNECFGENLVEYGSISDPKGAIAFVGPTSNTHTTYNNKMDKGIYKGMYQEGLDTPGEGLARGRAYQYAVFGAEDYYVEYHHKVFCVLGDPSIKIWKEIPLAVNVSHVATLPVGSNNITVAVNYVESGNFSENATVTLTNDNDLFVTGTTDSNGNITFNNVEVDNLGVINVTVTGGDIITYEGVINMTVAGVNDVINDIANFTSQPNPFSTETKINYTLIESNNTSINIYNVRGQLVRSFKSDLQAAGNHSIIWDGLNNQGNKLDSGVYFCQLVSGKNVRTIKLLMK
jgi:hypothetical protein